MNIVTSSIGTDCETIWGLPNSHFDWALLWTPTAKVERRKWTTDVTSHDNGTQTDPTPSEKGEKGYPYDRYVPSWSWCGWKGAVIEYDEITVVGSGADFNMQKWFQKHTWITYYIRDGLGRLRLVWDPSRHKPSDTDNSGGYESPEQWLKVSGSDSVRPVPKCDLHGRPYEMDCLTREDLEIMRLNSNGAYKQTSHGRWYLTPAKVA